MALSDLGKNKITTKSTGGLSSLGKKVVSKPNFTTVEGLGSYAEQSGLGEYSEEIVNPPEKLSFLQRLGSGLGALNPAEAILRTKETGGGLGTFLKEYPKTIFEGIGSAITGKEVGKEEERRGFKAVAEKLGVENGIAKFGLGFLGDVLLDPSTYFGGAIARGLGKAIGKTGSVALKGVAKVSPEAAIGLTTAKEGLQDAFGNLLKAGYKTQEGLVGDVMSFFGKRNAAAKGLAESNLARLGTGILTPEQNAEVFTRLAGGKRLEYTMRELYNEAIGDFVPKSEISRRVGEKVSANVLKGATGVVKETLESQMKRTAKFGEELVGDEFYRSYFPFLKKDKVSKFLYDTKGVSIGSEGYLKQFKNLLTNENMEQDVAKAFFNRETQVVTNKLTRDFLKKTVDDYGKPLTAFKSEQEAIQNGFKLLREKGVYGKELGYIPKWDMKFLEDMLSPEFKSIDMIAKATGFDAITSLFKRSVTGLFAPFHIRNYVSGMIQNFETLGIGALNPKTIASGQKLAFNAIKGVKMSGEYGKVLNPFMERFGFSSFFKNEFDNALNAGQDLASYEKAFSKSSLKTMVKTAGLSAEGTHFKLARNVGNFIEMQQKATAYIAALNQGKTIKEALKLAETAGFDYKMLTKFESQIMRRIVPFYSFTRKNIELQLKTLGTNPQRINQVMKLFSNNPLELVGVASGTPLTAEEQKALPEFIKESLGIQLKDTPEGLKTFVSSFGTPIEAFTQLFGSNPVLRTISQMNPLLKVPVELGIGKDSFRQRDLKDVYDAKEYKSAPQILKDLLDIKEVKKDILTKNSAGKLVKTGEKTQYIADPERLLIARSLFTSRGITYLDQLFGNDLKGFVKSLKVFTGIKPQTVDIEQQQGIKESEAERALQDLLIKYNKAKKYQGVYIPKNK